MLFVCQNSCPTLVQNWSVLRSCFKVFDQDPLFSDISSSKFSLLNVFLIKFFFEESCDMVRLGFPKTITYLNQIVKKLNIICLNLFFLAGGSAPLFLNED